VTSASARPQTSAEAADRPPRTGPLIAIGVYLGAPTALCAVRVARRPQYVSDDLTPNQDAFRPGISVWRTEEFDLSALGFPPHGVIPQVARDVFAISTYYDDAPVGILPAARVPPLPDSAVAAQQLEELLPGVARRVLWFDARHALTGAYARDPRAAVRAAARVYHGVPIQGRARGWREVITRHRYQHAMALAAGLACARAALWEERLSGLKTGGEGAGKR